MKHVSLSDPLGTLAEAIQGGQQTNTTPAGSISVPNADGTKTILGKAAGAAGVAPWVGDTTAPGVPTGVSASSTSGIVTVTWDGTLDGGVPEDFAYVTVLIDGVERGRLTHAGALPVDGLTVGAQVQVSATASDASRLEDGTLSPNVSAACDPVSVTVASVVSQDELDAVAKAAAAAKTAGDQAVRDAATAQGNAQSALDQLAGTVESELGNQAATAVRNSATALAGRQAVVKLLSSRGTTFKNNMLSTDITVTIFYAEKTITDIVDLQATFGAGAYLEWKWRRLDDEDWQTILSSDAHISAGGFTFTVSPDDVDAQTSFTCILNVPDD